MMGTIHTGQEMFTVHEHCNQAKRHPQNFQNFLQNEIK